MISGVSSDLGTLGNGEARFTAERASLSSFLSPELLRKLTDVTLPDLEIEKRTKTINLLSILIFGLAEYLRIRETSSPL